jgi:DNA (cytosine-5)-methyltransferase 1
VTIRAADLFCGAGGFTSGLLEALRGSGHTVDLLAVNHWDIAIATHSSNHPGVRHICETLDSVDPRKVVPEGRLDLLLASPECTHHSNARGGKPMSDQSRSTAWHVLRWAEALYIEEIIIENVREFRDWGPLDKEGRPIKAKKGALYRQFLSSLRALGYSVDVRILNAADYGDATSRKRLFVRASRRSRKIRWPEATHTPAGSVQETAGQHPYRTAREIIDWDLPGKSIYGRKRPLSPNTMRRIMAGLEKFSGLPFVVPQFSSQGPRSVDEPLGTLTTTSRGVGICEPFLVPNFGERDGQAPRCQSVDDPLPTVTSHGAGCLVEPFLVVLRNNQDAQSVDQPIPTLCANGNHLGVCEPFLVEYHGSHKERSDGDNRVRSVDEPLGTLDTSNRFAVAEPFLVNMKGQSNACSIDKPAPTITAGAPHLYVAEPYLTKYNGTGGAQSVDEPVDTITSKDRFGLVTPELVKDGEVAMLDIRFRMLQPHELSAAMGFPEDYDFAGNREAKVKQIGNAVAVNVAAALCRSALGISVDQGSEPVLCEAAG